MLNVVVHLAGELDYWTGPKVLEELDDAVWSRGTGSVVVDVTELRFVDSRGLAALIDGTAAARRHGEDVVIVGAGARLRRLVDTLRLSHLLTLNDGAIAAEFRLEQRPVRELQPSGGPAPPTGPPNL